MRASLTLSTTIGASRRRHPSRRGPSSSRTRSVAARDEGRHVVVIGAGAAGLASAVAAYDLGASVTVVTEATKVSQCNTAKASSGIAAAGTEAQQAVGIVDSPATFADDLLRSADDRSVPELAVFLSSASVGTLLFLRDKLGLDACSPAARVIQGGGHSAARVHRTPIDGRGSFGMQLLDAFSGYVDREAAAGLRFQFRLEKRVETISHAPGGHGLHVVLAPASPDTDSRASPPETLAATAVVIATRGRLWRQSDAAVPIRARLPTTCGPGAIGRGLRLGMEMGGAVTGMADVQIHPTALVDPAAPNSRSLWLAPEGLRGAGGLLLDAAGERFTNELGRRDAVSTAIRAHGFPIQPIRGCDDSTESHALRSAFLVLGESARAKFDVPAVYLARPGLATVVQGPAGLAAFMRTVCVHTPSTTTEALAAAVLRTFSDHDKAVAAARAGNAIDPDAFGKTVFASPSGVDEAQMASPPLVVMVVTPAVHYTMGGLRIDACVRVLTPAGAPIPGLFAAGEVTGGVHGANRLAGMGLLDSLTFGRAAGLGAAAVASGLVG